MGSFRHTKDDYIVINETLIMPLAFFVTQEAAYAIPVGAENQEYVQTSFRKWQDENTETALDIPWADGDTYIANIATYDAAYTLFLATPVDLAAAKTQQIALATTEAATYYNGDVTYSAVDYPASQRDRLHNELYYFARIGSYDVTHYIFDTDGNEVTMSFAAMTEVLDLMEKLYFKTNQNLDAHIAAINLLATINDVLAYDYTVGHETLPYTG